MFARQRDPTLFLFLTQRFSGALLAILLLVHLMTIMYAVQGELSVAEIVDRVRGNTVWVVFYGIFIVTAVVHSMIGLRNILSEMSNLHKRIVDMTVALYAIISFILGTQALRAIW